MKQAPQKALTSAAPLLTLSLAKIRMSLYKSSSILWIHSKLDSKEIGRQMPANPGILRYVEFSLIERRAIRFRR